MELKQYEKKILLAVNNQRYISEIARECNMHSGNVTTNCKHLFEKELIFYNKQKVKKIIMLTEKGQEVQILLLKLKSELK